MLHRQRPVNQVFGVRLWSPIGWKNIGVFLSTFSIFFYIYTSENQSTYPLFQEETLNVIQYQVIIFYLLNSYTLTCPRSDPPVNDAPIAIRFPSLESATDNPYLSLVDSLKISLI